MSWSQKFADPIALPGRKPLVTLRDAGNYVAGLSKREQGKPHWLLAAELLILVGNHGGDPMLARIAMMRALNHGKPAPAAEPRRKRARVFRIIG